MASRVKVPDPSRRRSALRWLTALPPFSFASLVALGCPPHEARLSITSDGIQTLIAACRPCARLADGGADPNCACALTGRPPPDIVSGVQARLFLVTPSDQAVRDASKCMTLLPCSDGGRPANCLAESLNQQLDGAIPRGLGFDGLQNPDDVLLMLAFYDSVDPMSTASCARTDLVACAGMRPPLGGGNYDISCASCQGGPKNAPGPDNGPCPKPRNSCFLDECDSILAKNAY
jgi:hypothetical protein